MTVIGIGVSIFTGSQKRGVTPDSIPANVGLPAISGEARVGVQLICSQGTWSGSPSPTFAYQWKADAVNVGTNANTFTPTAAEVAKVMTCQVTATNTSGNASATSLGTLPVAAAGTVPANTALPAVTGNAVVGSVLSCSTGTWTGTPTPTFTYQWQGNTVNIGGATNSAYTLLAGQLGQTVRCIVTATNPSGAVPATSSTTAAVTNPVSIPANTVLPAITGTTVVGNVLSCTTGTWTGNPTPTYTYQWRAGAAPISGATFSTFTLLAAQEGSVMDCVVTATNTGGSIPATSNETSIITVAPVAPSNSVAPAITGVARVGETLTCSSGIWAGTPAPTFGYQWQASAANINGATSPTYVLQAAQQNLVVRCVVTATNSVNAVQANSNNTAPIAAAGTQTIAQRLIGSEPNGISIGFPDNSCVVRDTVTPANNYDGLASSKVVFTRNSVGYAWNDLGVLTSFAINSMRFDYDPLTHVALGVLFEGAITNLCLQSQTLDDVAWTKDECTIAVNSTAAPDGTLTADTIVASVVGTAHRIIQNSLGVAGLSTTSLYVKSAGWNYVQLRNGVTAEDITFNLLTGAITDPGAGATATCAMVNVGNGWWRISMSVTVVAVTNVIIFTSSTGGQGDNGDGTSGVYVWGVQVEQQAIASSYFPTVAASATRGADVANIPVAAFPFSSTVGTLVSAPLGNFYLASPLKYIASLNDGSSANLLAHNLSSAQFNLVTAVSVNQANLSMGTGTINRIASAWALNDFAASAAGGAVLTDNAGTIPAGITTLTLGARNTGGASSAQGHVGGAMYLPRRVSDAELITLSTPFNTDAPPVNTVAPVISGTPTVGQTLSCTTGTWTGSPFPSLTYQWYDDAVIISGATASTFLLTATQVGGVITCRVTGTSTAGSDVGTSNSLGPVAAAAVASAHFWPLSSAQISGATVNDIGTSPVNGTIVNNLYPDDSQAGLDVGRRSNISGYITLPSSCLPASLNSAFSWFAFVRLADLAALSSNGNTMQTLYSDFKDSTNGIRIMMYRASSADKGKFKVSLFKTSGNIHWITSAQAWFDNNYEAHVGFTWSGTAFAMYVDGQPVASLSAASESKPDGNYIMARSATLGQINGSMAKLRIFNAALTANDVLNLYNADFVDTRPMGNPAGVGKMRFQDNFYGSVLDLGKWQPNWLSPNNTDITPPINGFETAAMDPLQVSLAASEVTFTSIAKAVVDYQGGNWSLVTGIINSGGPSAPTVPRFGYVYGYVEARIYMTSSGVNLGQALDNWPAWWTNGAHSLYGGWPGGGENDLTEGLGDSGNPLISSSRMHYHAPTPAGSGGGGADWNQSYAYGGNGALANAYHVYGCQWEPGSLKFYLDGVLVRTLTDSRVLNIQQFLVLNLGMSNGYPGGPQILPGTFKADWVRFYALP